MPVWLLPAILAVSALITMISGIWLALHLTALTRTYAGVADVVPSPARPRASRAAVRLAVALFISGTLVSLVVPVAIILGLRP